MSASNCINAASAVRMTEQKSGRRAYWLQSLVSVVIGGFGGGIVGPLLIGRPSIITANDNIVSMAIVWWYLIVNVPGVHYILHNYSLVKAVWTVGLGIFRTNAVIGVVAAAHQVLSAGPYYPVPLVGPIVVGTVQGSLGAFLPFDKGLAPIADGCAWPMQGALLTAATYHILVNDQTGFLGEAGRWAIRGEPWQQLCYAVAAVLGVPSGSVSVDRDGVVLAIAAVQVLTLLLQTFWRPAFNPFSALHGLLYAVFRVQGPSSSSSSSSSEKEKKGEGEGEEKPAGSGLLEKGRMLLAGMRSVLLPVVVAAISAVAQYYLLRYYSAPSPAATT
eukprot:gene25048-33560_t